MGISDKYNKLVKLGHFDEADNIYSSFRDQIDELENSGISFDEAVSKSGLTIEEYQNMINDYVGRHQNVLSPHTPKFDKMDILTYKEYIKDLERYVTGAGKVIEEYQRNDVNIGNFLENILTIYKLMDALFVEPYFKYKSMPFDKEEYLNDTIKETFNLLVNEYGIDFMSREGFPSIVEIADKLFRARNNKSKTGALIKKYSKILFYFKLLRLKEQGEVLLEHTDKSPNKEIRSNSQQKDTYINNGENSGDKGDELLSNIDKEKLKEYFVNSFIGRGSSPINNLNLLVEKLGGTKLNGGEIAQVAALIYFRKKRDTKNESDRQEILINSKRPESFAKWHRLFCGCIGVTPAKGYKRSKLFPISQRVKDIFDVLL